MVRGGGDLPESAKKCMESWRKICPNYKIKRWDESNFNIHCCNYVEKAYAEKKWAFVADYVRFFALYQEGGIYIETDSELVRPINELIEYNGFFGFGRELITVPMCGCSKHNLVARKILDYYEGCAFDPNNRKSYITVNQVVFHILTEYFGLIGNGKFQIVGDRIAVYPKEYFLARDYRTGIIKHYKELFVIHYGDGSWLGKSEKKRLSYQHRAVRRYGEFFGMIIGPCIYYLKEEGMGSLWRHLINKLRCAKKKNEEI